MNLLFMFLFCFWLFIGLIGGILIDIPFQDENKKDFEYWFMCMIAGFWSFRDGIKRYVFKHKIRKTIKNINEILNNPSENQRKI